MTSRALGAALGVNGCHGLRVTSWWAYGNRVSLVELGVMFKGMLVFSPVSISHDRQAHFPCPALSLRLASPSMLPWYHPPLARHVALLCRDQRKARVSPERQNVQKTSPYVNATCIYTVPYPI